MLRGDGRGGPVSRGRHWATGCKFPRYSLCCFPATIFNQCPRIMSRHTGGFMVEKDTELVAQIKGAMLQLIKVLISNMTRNNTIIARNNS